MKLSARLAYVFIFLFFLFFNGLIVYLILERLTEAKNKFTFGYSSALAATLGEYHNLKARDSSTLPDHAWIAYAAKEIDLERRDSQNVTFSSTLSSIVTDTVGPALVEQVVNGPAFKTIDMKLFERLFHKMLRSKHVNAAYRLDTIMIKDRGRIRQLLIGLWERKRNREYAYATSPMRLPYNSSIFVYAELKDDPRFFRKELIWPLLAFGLILVIGNAALIFVYNTIKKQRRINELKTDFINNITHEMKTPITIATAGIEAMEHYVAPTERTNFYLQTSKNQLHLLNDFVERILDAAVQDVSDLTLKKEKIDLHAVFNELVQSRSVLQGKPVNFRLTGEGPIYIHGDRLHLETAFHNIIDNAIKYSNGAVEISIDLVEHNSDSIIKIRDNGMGIPPQFIKNIFEKFFRVPQGDAQPVKGFGLGLYYVHNIIKKHGGTIAVHSKQQAGTEFIITLPIYK